MPGSRYPFPVGRAVDELFEFVELGTHDIDRRQAVGNEIAVRDVGRIVGLPQDRYAAVDVAVVPCEQAFKEEARRAGGSGRTSEGGAQVVLRSRKEEPVRRLERQLLPVAHTMSEAPLAALIAWSVVVAPNFVRIALR